MVRFQVFTKVEISLMWASIVAQVESSSLYKCSTIDIWGSTSWRQHEPCLVQHRGDSMGHSKSIALSRTGTCSEQISCPTPTIKICMQFAKWSALHRTTEGAQCRRGKAFPRCADLYGFEFGSSTSASRCRSRSDVLVGYYGRRCGPRRPALNGMDVQWCD